MPTDALRQPLIALLGGEKEDVRLLQQMTGAQVVGLSRLYEAKTLVIMWRFGGSVPDVLRRAQAARWLVILVDRRRQGQRGWYPGRAMRALRRAGWRLAGEYWAKPSAVNVTAWIPLTSVPAVRWYVCTQLIPVSLARRGVSTLVARAPTMASRLMPWLVSSYGLVAVRDSGLASHDEVSARPMALAAAKEAGLLPAYREAAVVTGGEGAWSRVTTIPFGDRSGVPAVVVKSARLSEHNGATEAEQATLQSLRAHLPADLVDSLPQPMGMTKLDELSVAVESFVPGAPLHLRLEQLRGRPEQQAGLIRLAAEWLTRFHLATSGEPVPAARADVRAMLDETLSRYSRIFAHESPAERELANQAGEQLAQLYPASAPTVIVHRDLGPWNVILTGPRKIAVIDWEMAAPGPPLLDLLYFLLHCTWVTRRHQNPDEQVGEMLELIGVVMVGDPVMKAAQEATSSYLAQLGLDARLVPALLVAMLGQQALDRHDRLQAVRDPRAGERAHNRYVACLARLASSDLMTGLTGSGS
ncbi:hypothetical protein BH23CHL7_BH23CHL7_06640 [soil metagenome]